MENQANNSQRDAIECAFDSYFSAIALEKRAKEQKVAAMQVIQNTFNPQLQQILKGQGKTHGSTSLKLDNGYKITGEQKRDVKYDSEALLQTIEEAELPWERIKEIFKVKVSVAEKEFNMLPEDSPLKASIRAARTEEIKPISLKSIEMPKEAE